MLLKNTRNIAATLLLGSLAAQACGSQVVSARVDIRAPSEMVAGFPMPIELFILGKAEIVESSMLGDVSTFAFVLESDDRWYSFNNRVTHIVKSTRPPRYNDPHNGKMVIGTPKTIIPANMRGRFLLDLTHLDMYDSSGKSNPFKIESGNYTLRLHVKEQSPLHGQQSTIEIMEPNIMEHRLIDRLAAIESDRPRWETFVLHADEILEGIPIVLLSDAGRRQIGYHLLLANLVHDPRDIAQLTIEDDAISQSLWPGYRTSVLLLRYEIALAADNQDQIDLLKEVIQQINPTALKSFRQFEMFGWPIGRLRRLMLKQEKELTGQEKN